MLSSFIKDDSEKIGESGKAKTSSQSVEFNIPGSTGIAPRFKYA